jgi:predicted aconitase with swiveling domain
MANLKTSRGRKIVEGEAEGDLLFSSNVLHLLGGIDAETGVILESNHDLNGQSITGRVLAFPRSVGSSVGSYVLYKLKKLNLAPAAIINEDTDIITASGCALANIPLVDRLDTSLLSLPRRSKLHVNANEGTVSWYSP